MSRRTIAVAACLMVAAAAVVLFSVASGLDEAVPSAGPTSTARLVRHHVDQLSIRYPATWVTLAPVGPPCPGRACIGEYLTNATADQRCGARRADDTSASRCTLPLSTLRRGQVLVALSEGVYAPLGGASVPVVHGHRTRTDLGRVPSFETGVSVSDCPAGATNFAWTIIDEQPAAQESRYDRRNLVHGYGIFICINSATTALPATAKHLIESLTITN